MAPLGKIEVDVAIQIGSAEMPLRRLLRLSRGAAIALGGDADGPLAILANGAHIAEGHVRLDGERVNVVVSRRPRA
jgi:flagellar motor switch protein FliN/FliY